VTIRDLSASSGLHRRDHGTADLAVDETAPPPRARPSRVPPRYASANDTPLREEIKPGHQVIDLEVESP